MFYSLLNTPLSAAFYSKNPEGYSESIRSSKMDLLRKALSYTFDWFLNKPLKTQLRGSKILKLEKYQEASVTL